MRRPTATWACNWLRTKHFHGVSSGNQHPCLLTSQYGKVRVVDWKANRGKRAAMAEGFRRTQGEIVVQLDSDSYIDPKTFRNLIQPFRNVVIGAVCAHTDPANADENLL